MGHWPPPQYPCELTCSTQIPGSKRNTPKSKKKWWEVRCWSQNFSPVPQMTVVLWWSSLARSLWRSRQPQGLWYPPGVWWPCGRYRDHHDCWMSAVSLPCTAPGLSLLCLLGMPLPLSLWFSGGKHRLLLSGLFLSTTLFHNCQVEARWLCQVCGRDGTCSNYRTRAPVSPLYPWSLSCLLV